MKLRYASSPRRFICDSCKTLAKPLPLKKCEGCKSLMRKSYERSPERVRKQRLKNKERLPLRKDYMRAYQRDWMIKNKYGEYFDAVRMLQNLERKVHETVNSRKPKTKTLGNSAPSAKQKHRHQTSKRRYHSCSRDLPSS